jgi:hypothetical protein
MSNVVNNTGVNYSLYYNVLDYFKTIMVNHPQIESVSQGDLFSIDDNAFTFYPLANVTILGANFTPSTTEYQIQIIVADKIKNKNNESNEGINYIAGTSTNAMRVPFDGPDDRVNIWANTLGIINDLTSFTQYSVESFQINDTILNEPFYDRFNNGLAGWSSTFTLTTHNARPRCLYDLYTTSDFNNLNC